MKLIFDFDDTLFNNTKQFKEQMYRCIAEKGISREIAEKEYEEIRTTDAPFSLKKFLTSLAIKNNIDVSPIDGLYEDIMAPCPEFLNQELLAIVRDAGVKNCYIVSNGDDEFQRAKIEKSGIANLFKEIYITPNTKKDIIAKMCNDYPTERIIFIDNKERFFSDLDMNKCSNLTTILFDINGLDRLTLELLKN